MLKSRQKCKSIVKLVSKVSRASGVFTVQPGAAEGRLRRPKAAFVFPFYKRFRLIHRINPQEDSQRVILEIHPQDESLGGLPASDSRPICLCRLEAWRPLFLSETELASAHALVER